jgi:hypothetical protein
MYCFPLVEHTIGGCRFNAFQTHLPDLFIDILQR